MATIVIDENIVDKNNTSLSQVLTLLMVSNNIDLKETIDSLISRGLLEKDIFNKLSLTKKAEILLTKVVLDSNPEVPDGSKLLELVNTLKSLFPEGKKPGTCLYWRGNQMEIVRKLRSFFNKYKRYSDEDIIDATRRYVESFNGDYQFMQVLKYFILKRGNALTGDTEEKSELASYIENKGQEETRDWKAALI